MQLQPAVRLCLTFVVAALSCLVGLVDNETVRLICLPLITGLAAVGIVPPQVPTRTVLSNERGAAGVSVLGAVVLLVLIVVLFHATHGFSLLLLLLIVVLLIL